MLLYRTSQNIKELQVHKEKELSPIHYGNSSFSLLYVYIILRHSSARNMGSEMW